jgi:hypothetical protein
MIVIISFAALALDVSQMTAARNELQRAADAAALAGASAYFTDTGLKQDYEMLDYMISSRARALSGANVTLRDKTLLDKADLAFGTYDYSYPDAGLDFSGAARLNAVEVSPKRTTDSSNGGVVFFFAPVFGEKFGNVSVSATAVADDRFAGLRIEEMTTTMLPITMHVDLYDYLAENGEDEYAADDSGVSRGSDGIPEVKLYPWKAKSRPVQSGGSESSTEDVLEPEPEGAGNFGLLDFGASGTSDLADDIQNGLTAAEIEAALGTSEPTYFDDSGSATTYQINGEPGLRASLEDDLASHVGEVIGLFVHDDVTSNGTNADFRNIGIRFGRVVEVELGGSVKALVIQPVAYSGSSVILSENAPSTDGRIGRVVLVK